MLSHNILYVLETDISVFSQNVHSWLRINFPFIQLFVPHLELSFKEVICQFISPLVSKQLRPQMLDLDC